MMLPSEERDIEMPLKIAREAAKVYEKIGSFGPREFVNAELAEPSTHLLKRPGKMLRPALVFLGADYIGVDSLSEYVGLGAAIELLHISSLVHDDIVDKDVSRRGVEATHVKYGTEKAILSGDALISMAVSEANRYGGRVVGAISDAAMKMCAGEMVDYRYQNGSVVPSIDEYLRVAELKSSTLIGTSTSIVALHRSDERAVKLRAFGMGLGIAFQIRDDILDFSGTDGGADSGRHRLNIVRCIKEHDGVGDSEAVAKAAEMNNMHVDKALSELDDGSNAELFRDYAGRVKVSVESA